MFLFLFQVINLSEKKHDLTKMNPKVMEIDLSESAEVCGWSVLTACLVTAALVIKDLNQHHPKKKKNTSSYLYSEF